MLTNQQFDRTRRLASRLAGIELAERHRDLLGRRGRRLGLRTADGFDALLGAAEQDDPAATRQLVGLLTTKFTGFFRHPHHFEIATAQAVRAVKSRGRARLWSAGTATGEEAWSLAMVLVEGFQPEAAPVSILATDVDVEALAGAELGEYGEAALPALSPGWREKFLVPAEPPPRWRVVAALRRLVEFKPLNLVSPDWAASGPFDVIFCRNVLMYLEARHRRAALERFAGFLSPAGILLLDPTEHLGAADRLFVAGGSGVYHRRREAIEP